MLLYPMLVLLRRLTWPPAWLLLIMGWIVLTSELVLLLRAA
ncbi:hypothetical protein QTI33_05005 [Variovorax sp. J22P271]|nr:hypothetical protein [Variovorax sp. J22P271]MDM0031497.1 hypothetical protein [Variovorax sp. J22P271]